jgi:hypothetical protein
MGRSDGSRRCSNPVAFGAPNADVSCNALSGVTRRQGPHGGQRRSPRSAAMQVPRRRNAIFEGPKIVVFPSREHGGQCQWNPRNDTPRSTAYHEAGHAVVAFALGLLVGTIRVRADDAGGTTEIEPADHLTLIDQIALCHAGTAAEQLFDCRSHDWAFRWIS